MVDYIEYELNKLYEQEQLADDMERLGFDNYEDYDDYLRSLHEDCEKV